MTQGTATPDDREPGAEEQRGPTIRDRRRIDPETGALRKPASADGGTAGTAGTAGTRSVPAESAGETPRAESEPGDRISELEREQEALQDDLKRLQAEYINYKRRVDRDRQSVREVAVGSVLTDLLPVLDDIGRAREHGELEGGFKAVAEALEMSLTKLGLERYGEAGDPFDPRIHEALMHQYAEDVDGPTCQLIVQPGYRHGERVLRAARVAVVEPTVGLPDSSSEAGESAAPGAGVGDAEAGEPATGAADAGQQGENSSPSEQ